VAGGVEIGVVEKLHGEREMASKISGGDILLSLSLPPPH
jgi:hypothetical protein